MIGTSSSGLQLTPGVVERCHVFDERIDGEQRGHRLLVHAEVVFAFAGDATLDVDGMRVDPAENHTTTNRQRHRRGEQAGHVRVVVVLVDREEGVALEQVVLAPVRVPRHRRVMAMEHERGGHVVHAPAEHPKAPTEVDVLEEHEVPLVEAAGRLEHTLGHHHRGTRCEQHVVRHVELRVVRRPHVQLEAMPVEAQCRVDEVDRVAIPGEHLARHATDVAVRLEFLDRGGQPLSVGSCVVVEKRHELTASGCCAGVTSAGEPGVAGELEHRDIGMGRANSLGAAVARVVLDDDDLELVCGPLEVAQTVETGDGVVSALVVHDDD
ncbi:unannotated protein [freshwater metagenome]|uniref:Unannotated protein n=1 Tax=freshwater metagenome TaxID=449393 RepID=A0A6J7RH78_9ZZZZ